MPENRGGIGPSRTVYLMPIKGLTHGEWIPPRGFWFPVAPREYSKAGTANWNSVNIIGVGEVIHRGGANLQGIEMESFFPGEQNMALCRALRSTIDFLEPDDACNRLEKIRDNQVIFQLNVGGGDIIQERAVITDFSWSERAGSPLDRQFSIRFQTWRTQQVERRGETILPPIPKAYRLREGEDLDDAALRIFGNVNKTDDIAALNGIKRVGTKTTKAGRTVAAAAVQAAGGASLRSGDIIRIF